MVDGPVAVTGDWPDTQRHTRVKYDSCREVETSMTQSCGASASLVFMDISDLVKSIPTAAHGKSSR